MAGEMAERLTAVTAERDAARAEVARLKAELEQYVSYRIVLDRATERAEQAESALAAARASQDAYAEVAHKAESETARLKETLKQYGQHATGCVCRSAYWSNRAGLPSCDCGLDAALASGQEGDDRGEQAEARAARLRGALEELFAIGLRAARGCAICRPVNGWGHTKSCPIRVALSQDGEA